MQVGPTPVPVTAPACRRGGGGHKRISTVVDIEQRTLCALEHHLVAVAKRFVEHHGGVGYERSHLLGGAGVVLVHLLGIERLGAEESVSDSVLLVAGVLDVRAQQRGVQQIDNAQAAAVHLVFIRRADAPAGRADLRTAGRVLGSQLDHPVVRQNDLGAVRNE